MTNEHTLAQGDLIRHTDGLWRVEAVEKRRLPKRRNRFRAVYRLRNLESKRGWFGTWKDLCAGLREDVLIGG